MDTTIREIQYRGWRSLLRSSIPVFLVGGLMLQSARAEEQPSCEYEVKAVFLYKICQFVAWPKGSLAPPGGEFRIAIVGRDPFEGSLDRIVSRKAIKDRIIKVRHFRTVELLEPCDLLFIAPSEEARLEMILAKLSGRATLVVGDSSGFAKRGVAINFYHWRGKIRFEINIEATQKAGLKISAKLLHLAHIIDESEE